MITKQDSGATPLEYSNREWINLLKHPADNRALAQLRSILVRRLNIALTRIVTRERDQFVEDSVQEGLLNILEYIETFRGESNFLTWAQKIVLNKSYERLRRKHWEILSIYDYKSHISNINDGEDISELMLIAPEPNPEELTIYRHYLEKVVKVIQEELSEKQRTALVYNKFYGISPALIAKYHKTSKSSIYKRIFDARKKIRQSLGFTYKEFTLYNN